MKKILYVLQGLGYGGVSRVLLNYYKHIKNNFKADFVVKDDSNLNSEFANELREYGCNIFPVTSFNKNMIKYSRDVGQIIKNGNYDIVHDNNKYFGFLSLYQAKKYGVKKRISHIHNTIVKSEKKFLHRLFICVASKLTVYYATNLMACSRQAGKSMFANKEFYVLNNAIDAEQYKFDNVKRNMYRKEKCFENAMVVITVARYDTLKRYDFAFKVFEQLSNINSKFVYVIAGVEKKELKNLELNSYNSLSDETKNKIIFMGKTGKINELLNAADVFLLTSEHEGLGIAVIEAQASGLPCVVSTGLPEEVKVTDLVSFKSLTDPLVEWANEINNKAISTDIREKYNAIIEKSEFSIKEQSNLLIKYYEG